MKPVFIIAFCLFVAIVSDVTFAAQSITLITFCQNAGLGAGDSGLIVWSKLSAIWSTVLVILCGALISPIWRKLNSFAIDRICRWTGLCLVTIIFWALNYSVFDGLGPI